MLVNLKKNDVEMIGASENDNIFLIFFLKSFKGLSLHKKISWEYDVEIE